MLWGKSRLGFFIFLGVAISSATSSVHAQDTDTRYDFRIEEETLGQALRALHDSTGVLLWVDYDLASTTEIHSVVGRRTIDEALKEMLQGSGLVSSLTESGMIIISRIEKENPEGTMTNNQVKKSLLASVAAFVFGTTGVGAQEVANERAGPEEIIVTATRRAASMKDIPMSINAFSGEKLEVSGTVDLRDVQFLAAGLQVATQAGVAKITMRGVTESSSGRTVESGVAMHRDGVYLGNRRERRIAFFDVDRIEVLRGPQGTLYGRNATGGAINVITNSPTTDFETGGRVTIGNYDLIETEGYVSGPIVDDTLLGRIAFITRDNKGFTPNILNGERHDKFDVAAIRGKLSYQPTDNMRIDIIGDFARDDSSFIAVQSKRDPSVALPGELLGGTLATGRAVNLNDDQFEQERYWGVSARAEVDLGSVTFASLTSYRNYDLNWAMDVDGTDASALFLRAMPGEDSVEWGNQFSQELTLTSANDTRLQWVLGGFYYRATDSAAAHVGIPTINATQDRILDKHEANAYAVFGEASYSLLDRLTLTLGARYSYEEKSIAQHWDLSLLSIGATLVSSEQLDKNWNSFTPKGALTFTLNDEVTLYATAGQGFKAGGFTNEELQGQAFDPEEVMNYEAGAKVSLFDNRLRGSVAAFYMDYKDLQVQIRREHPVTGLLQNVVANAAESTIRGVELEFLAQPTDRFAFDGNVSFLDARFDQWPDAFDGTLGASFDVSGNRMPATPRWATNLGAAYTFPIGSWGAASLRGEYSYKSEVFFSPFEDTFRSQDEFSLFNARLAFEGADGRLNVAFWAKNISDELIVAERNASALTTPVYTTYLPPRTYGVTIGYRF